MQTNAVFCAHENKLWHNGGYKFHAYMRWAWQAVFFYIFDQTPVIESYIKTKLTKTCAMHRFNTVNPVLSSHSKIDKIDKW